MSVRTVLVVEDDPLLRAQARKMFEAAGYETESVETADQALRFVWERSDCTALVVADIKTPGSMDGLGLARLLKTHWPHVEVVVTSGQPVAKSSLPEGVRFTAKPWLPEDILSLTRTTVRRASTEQQQHQADADLADEMA